MSRFLCSMHIMLSILYLWDNSVCEGRSALCLIGWLSILSRFHILRWPVTFFSMFWSGVGVTCGGIGECYTPWCLYTEHIDLVWSLVSNTHLHTWYMDHIDLYIHTYVQGDLSITSSILYSWTPHSMGQILGWTERPNGSKQRAKIVSKKKFTFSVTVFILYFGIYCSYFYMVV